MRDYLVLKRSLILMHRKYCELQVPATSCFGMNWRLVGGFGVVLGNKSLAVVKKAPLFTQMLGIQSP